MPNATTGYSIISDTKLDAIADAITAQDGGDATMTADQMAERIALIPGQAKIDALIDGRELENVYTRANNFHESVFMYCSELESVYIDATGDVTIGPAAFYECYSLASVIFGENVSDVFIDEDCFAGCTSLEELVGPISGLGTRALHNAQSIKRIISTYDGSGETIYFTLDGYLIFFMNYLDLIDVSCAPYIGQNANVSVSEFVIRDEMQVGVLEDSAAAGNVGCFYVPDALLNSYRSSTNWAAVASKIFPLSEYVAS